MSTRITNSMVQHSVLADLNAVSGRLTRTQEKVASGKEITRPSDDPYAASRAVGLRATLDKTDQYLRNVEDGQGWQDASEQALDEITKFVETAKERVVQGGTDTLDQAGRNALKVQIDQIIGGIKQEANTNYQGRYLFSGVKTLDEPYPDPAPAPHGADDYMGDSGSGLITRTIGPKVSVQINTRIDGVLGSGGTDGKLLSTLRKTSGDLASANTTDLRGSDLSDLDKHLNDLDADIAKTLIDFNSQSAAYQAALKAGANIIQPSLMDFLGG